MQYDHTGTEAKLPVIRVSNMSKHFGQYRVLDGVTLDLHKGENIVVLGKSGSGKSVFIKCIIGLLKPDSGEVKVFGQNIHTIQEKQLDNLRASVGFLFQSNALYDSMSVRENLVFPLRRHGRDKSPHEVEALVMEALTNVGLAHTVDLMPEELSGGMRKRVALARALILKPDIILYDEPTTGLDPITSKEIVQLILDIQKIYHTSSIIISHDMECVKKLANRIVMLIDGRFCAEGTYDELSAMNDPAIYAFFH